MVLAVAMVGTAALPAHAEIDPGPGSSYPDWLVNLGGTVLFSADDGANGVELWKSDGASTTLVKDINTTDCEGSGPNSFPNQLVVSSGRVFFSACDDADGFEPWVSDGTTSGTHILADIKPGIDGSFPYSFTAANGLVFFGADDGTDGRELWKTDGTTTSMVTDLFPGPEGSNPGDLTAFGTKVFFSADDGTDGIEPWTSDGTTTQIVKNIRPLDKSSGPFFGTTVVGSKILFFGAETDNTISLYSSDGTAPNTSVIKSDIFPGEIKTVGSLAYFSDPFGPLLYKTDGTTVSLVADVEVVSDMTAVDSTLFFRGFDFAHGVELWTSNGTAGGTHIVKNIRPGRKSSFVGFDTGMVDLAGTLIFDASDGVHGDELWRSDGTTAGTAMVKNINKKQNGKASSYPVVLTPAGSDAFFAADDGIHGFELWTSDGTRPGTTIVP
jgi:ELWxxDGT repeat protein